ncbi:MAG: hypothetical protein JSW39_13855, partial [Desulfobacterales bacterium]
MKESKISKKNAARVGREFTIMFNRTSMYQSDHPFAVQSIDSLYTALTKALNSLSPIALIMNREEFFIEDEPLDSRLNRSKMVGHFKKAGIESISFQRGLSKGELENYVKVFADIRKYPTAAAMKTGLVQMRVAHIKINHVVFKKMTVDDEVVAKDELKSIAAEQGAKPASPSWRKELLSTLAGNMVMEELEKSISLESLIGDPVQVSAVLIDKDLAISKEQTEVAGSGVVIAHQLHRIRDEVDRAVTGSEKVSLPQLADAVFDMKKKLLEGIEAQKALGVIYENEEVIRQESDELTDRVVIELVKEEYRQGEISIPRLAQILKRLAPESGELKRLLPKLKEALLAEGMPLNRFLKLVQELGKELQNEELTQVLQKGAEAIGLNTENLIQEVISDPKGAAELIYLASEIKRGAGDPNVLTELLVDYVERLGSKLALDALDTD